MLDKSEPAVEPAEDLTKNLKGLARKEAGQLKNKLNKASRLLFGQAAPCDSARLSLLIMLGAATISIKTAANLRRLLTELQRTPEQREEEQRAEDTSSFAQSINQSIKELEDKDDQTLETVLELLSPNTIAKETLSKNREAKRGVLQFIDLLSTAFEALQQPEKKDSNRRLEKADKETSARDLIKFTQVLTPLDIVSFMVQYNLDALLANSEAKALETLKILDPACGTGNFLFAAQEYLLPHYLKRGESKQEAFAKIWRNNLWGIEIDSSALACLGLLRAFSAILHGLTAPKLEANLLCLEDKTIANGQKTLLGSLDKNDKRLTPFHDCDLVLANPPYLGRRLLDRELKKALKENYPGCHNELGHAFLSRAFELVKKGGRVSFIMQSSILSLPSARTIREQILTNHLENVVLLGSGIFPFLSGEKADSAILNIRQAADNDGTAKGKEESNQSEIGKRETRQFDLRNIGSDRSQAFQSILQNREPLSKCQVRKQEDFQAHESKAFNFSRPRAASKLYNSLPKLADLAEIKQGLATSDNERFLRYIWEVEKDQVGKRYQPYIKGRGNKRWYHPIDTVIDWQDGGGELKKAVEAAYPYLKGRVHWVVKNEDFYFKAGLTFSFVGTKTLAVREMPAGCIFDVGGSAIFPGQIDLYLLLAYLNSSLAMTFAQDINPTINFQVGDLKKLPVPNFAGAEAEKLRDLAVQAIKESKKLFMLEAPQIIPALQDGATIEPESQEFPHFELYTVNQEGYLSYRKAHHLALEKLIELDSASNELTLKIAARGMTLSEHTELMSWVDNFQRPENQKIKDSKEFCLTFICALLYKQLNKEAVLDLAGFFEQSCFDRNYIETQLGEDLLSYAAKLNEKLPSLYHQQPPFLVLQLGGKSYAAAMSLFKLPTQELFKNLQDKCGEISQEERTNLLRLLKEAEGRSRKVFDYLKQQ